MGELHDELAVKIGRRLATISEFIEDQKQVVAGSIKIFRRKFTPTTSLLLLYWSTVLVNHLRLNAKLKVLFS